MLFDLHELRAACRVLAPGKYTLVAESKGYGTKRHAITVPGDGSGARHNFTFSANVVQGSRIAVQRLESDASSDVRVNFGVSHRKNLNRDLPLEAIKRRSHSFGTLVTSHYVLWAMMFAAALVVYFWSQRKRRHRRPS